MLLQRERKVPRGAPRTQCMICHFCRGPFSTLQQGKAVCGHWGKAIVCATWGIPQIRAFLRMPPKPCSLTQPVSRTVRHKLFRLQFDVRRAPINWPKKGRRSFRKEKKVLSLLIRWNYLLLGSHAFSELADLCSPNIQMTVLYTATLPADILP